MRPSRSNTSQLAGAALRPPDAPFRGPTAATLASPSGALGMLPQKLPNLTFSCGNYK